MLYDPLIKDLTHKVFHIIVVTKSLSLRWFLRQLKRKNIRVFKFIILDLRVGYQI